MSRFATISIALTCLIGVSFAGQSTKPELMKAVLLTNFPEHMDVVGPWDEGETALREYPGDFVNGILVGDFNSDGTSDFAAKLARPLTPEETKSIHPSLRDRMTTAEIVVGCDAQEQAESAKDFRCYTLVGQAIGGVHATLDYMDWEWVLGTLEDEEQPACQAAIRSRAGTKSLSLIEPNGHCDTYFYPKEGGGYDKCTFCAD